MSPLLKNFLKTTLLGIAVGIVVSISFVQIAGLFFSADEVKKIIGPLANPLWLGAFIGVLNAISAVATPPSEEPIVHYSERKEPVIAVDLAPEPEPEAEAATIVEVAKEHMDTEDPLITLDFLPQLELDIFPEAEVSDVPEELPEITPPLNLSTGDVPIAEEISIAMIKPRIPEPPLESAPIPLHAEPRSLSRSAAGF